jgi:metal-responsive CopG/Arc/MetJ family transcriptional regulator
MNDKVKNKRMHLHMPEHLKSKVESAANYYGITQTEFIKDAIKEKLRHYLELEEISLRAWDKVN